MHPTELTDQDPFIDRCLDSAHDSGGSRARFLNPLTEALVALSADERTCCLIRCCQRAKDRVPDTEGRSPATDWDLFAYQLLIDTCMQRALSAREDLLVALLQAWQPIDKVIKADAERLTAHIAAKLHDGAPRLAAAVSETKFFIPDALRDPLSRPNAIEHAFDEIARQVESEKGHFADPFDRIPTAASLRDAPPGLHHMIITVAMERSAVLASAIPTEGPSWTNPRYREYYVLVELIAAIASTAVRGNRIHVDELCEWAALPRPWAYCHSKISSSLLHEIVLLSKSRAPTPVMTRWLTTERAAQLSRDKPDDRALLAIRRLLGEELAIPLIDGEAWSDRAIEDIDATDEAARIAWASLLLSARTSTSSKPSAKWLKTARAFLAVIGTDAFMAKFREWSELLDRPRAVQLERQSEYAPAFTNRNFDPHLDVWKGLCWIASTIPNPDLARSLGRLAISAYRKVPGIGPRAVKVGNAAVYALGQMPGLDSVGQLAVLRVKVKFGTAQKGIEKALTAAAAREKLPREEIEELGIPTYGLTEVGRRSETLGDFTAELIVTGIGDTELRFIPTTGAKAGKVQKSIPAALKASHADDLKDLKSAAKDIAAMLPAQRDRIDAMFLDNKSWSLSAWRERYLDHPLVGILARRLIWRITDADSNASRSVTWLDSANALVHIDGSPATIDPNSARVRLWHPVEVTADEVLAWRRFFEDRQIKQPFKQAHREVYLLTDAERTTATYSNRFAAHVIRQHQFNALCGIRGWKNKLRLMVDDEYPPPSRRLTAHNLRAEFWVEGAGDEFGRDTNESGVFLYLSTDQVRFYPIDAGQVSAHAYGGGYRESRAETLRSLAIDQIPILVLSEILRDVDLFVGVCSIGNNPAWNDGGTEVRHGDYWQSYSFGELSETGKGRQDLLKRLVPKLTIAAACSFSGRYLTVKGSYRTYKIHLGSGNILMEPNDQYLCIVPTSRDESGAATPQFFLPFEGDRTLSIILSKAFMLAADDQIKDPSIVRQIKM